MLSEQQIYYSFKNIRGTPQYKHNQLLDVLAQVNNLAAIPFSLHLLLVFQNFGLKSFKCLDDNTVNILP